MTTPAAHLLAAWDRACTESVGVCLTTDSRRILTNGLYEFRKSSGNAAYWDFSIMQPPSPNEVWIVRRTNGQSSGGTADAGLLEPIHQGCGGTTGEILEWLDNGGPTGGKDAAEVGEATRRDGEDK